MNKLIAATAALLVSGACFAQAGTAVKDSATAVSEKAKEAKENTQAAASGQPEKTIHTLKGKYHKQKSAAAADDAKDAAKATVK